MFKRLLIVTCCIIIGIFFSAVSYSQDDPSTTQGGDVKVTDAGVKTTAASPDAKIFFSGGNTYINPKVQFKLQAKDNIALDKIIYRVDSGEVQAYQNPFTIESEGTHIVSFYGVDKIGNQEEAKLYRVIVDSTPPEVSAATNLPVVKANSKFFISKNFTFTINTYDRLSGISKVSYSLNGEAKEYTAPFSIASEGDVELKVSSVDNVNNSSEQFSMNVVDDKGNAEALRESSAKLTVDNNAPTVQITPSEELKKSDDNKNIASSAVKYGVTAADSGSGVSAIQIRIDGLGDFSSYLNEIKFKANGEHQIEAKAIDRVGNVSAVTTLSVYVDTIPPESKMQTLPE